MPPSATCGRSSGNGSCGGRSSSIRVPLGDNSDAGTAEETGGPPTATWCCSTRQQSAPSATTTGEHASQRRGRLVRKASREPTGLVESPLRGDVHGGFGRRLGETHRR